MREWRHEFVCIWVFVFHQFAVSFVRMCFIHSMSCSIEKVSNAEVLVSGRFKITRLERVYMSECVCVFSSSIP